jgi:hypothetical protein
MKRLRTSLVSQYLEGISRAALAEYQKFFREQARRRNGVYALYQRKKLYYVGLARDLRGRLRQHLKDKHGQSWDRFSMYLTIGDDHIRELESLVIRIVKPSGNLQMDHFRKAQNLRRDFARRVRQDARDRLDMLLGRSRTTVLRKPSGRGKRASRAAVLAAYITKPMSLRGTYQGKKFEARVRRNGPIFCAGRRFNSPSMAARHAMPMRRAVNGWTFWNYERAPGDWVRLKDLRK